MKYILSLLLVVACIGLVSAPLKADDVEYKRLERSFENFVTCELTRIDAIDHFKGKPFTIAMIDLFDFRTESDVKILTGAIKCFVGDRYQTLYVAIGVHSIAGKEQVGYYTIRNKDFSILGTELFQFPYKERCKWSPYGLDVN